MSDIGIKISIKEPDDFLLIKESLTRIGVASHKTKTLYQSAHILHRKGFYYICHFKSLFALDNKKSDISEEDILRRNLITKLLSDWGLLTVDVLDDIKNVSPLSSVTILPFKEKDNWKLVTKYTLGNGISHIK